MIACPSREQIARLLAQELAPEEQVAVESHVQCCTACAEFLSVFDSTGRWLKGLAPPEDVGGQDPEVLQNKIGPQAPAAGGCEVTELTNIKMNQQLGPYLLLELLDKGGMGKVYKARHVHLGKIMAVKLLREKGQASEEVLARFRQEMQAIGRLNHPNIVVAHDAGAALGMPYLAMENIEGVDLARLVKARGPLPVADACEVIRQASLGLQHAHENGLVHRDIKPSNLMLTSGGVVKVLDLGLARLREAPADAGALTIAGYMMGTPDYMAPEQWADPHLVDVRADIYSLGCTLYHLLAGQPPFFGPDYNSLGKKNLAHLEKLPPPIGAQQPEVSHELASLVERLLAKEPNQRPATPAAVAELLQAFTGGCCLADLLTPRSGSAGDSSSSPSTRPATAPEQTPRLPEQDPKKKRRMPALSAGALVLGLCALLIYFGGLLPFARPNRLEASMKIRHFQAKDAKENKSAGRIEVVRLGSIGPGSTAARLGDFVQVEVQFNLPAHCYLIAFNPNGQEQLLYPDPQSKAPPEEVNSLVYPAGRPGETKGFSLTDGAGQQAFIVLASRKPLPDYGEWRLSLGVLPWKSTQDEGAWAFQDGSLRRLDRDRGAVRSLELPVFEELCRALQRRSGMESVAACAFLVKSREGPP